MTPANEGVPLDPNRNVQLSDMRARPTPAQPAEPYAFASRRDGALPGYRPDQLPAAPRNPIAEREASDLRQAPPRQPLPGQRPPGAPVMLYGQGQGPFLPLKENEIDPEDLDPVTGSIGE